MTLPALSGVPAMATTSGLRSRAWVTCGETSKLLSWMPIGSP
jgi:hypothetical protein